MGPVQSQLQLGDNFNQVVPYSASSYDDAHLIDPQLQESVIVPTVMTNNPPMQWQDNTTLSNGLRSNGHEEGAESTFGVVNLE
jgi:hypothetical protein